MKIQLSSLRNATFAMIAGSLAIAACSGSSDGGPATIGNDSGVAAEASAMDDGSTGSDSATAADTASPTDAAVQMDTGGLKPFGATCGGNSECTSNVCFTGGMGSYCSLHCTGATAATDCPVPPTSGQCNGMGFCKKP